MTGPTSTRAAGAFPIMRQSAPVDRAAALHVEWQHCLAEIDRRARVERSLWKDLPTWARVGMPLIPADHPAFIGMTRPHRDKPIVMARDDLEEYGAAVEKRLAGTAALERAREVNKARLAAWDAAMARVYAAHEASGYTAARSATEAAHEHLARLEETLCATEATTLAGIIAKLTVAVHAIPFGYCEETEPLRVEDRILRSVLADAKRLEGSAVS